LAGGAFFSKTRCLPPIAGALAPVGRGTIGVSVEAATVIGVQMPGATSRGLTWLRGIGVRQVRLATGLVMFSYLFSHLFNHALGNLSYDLMEQWLSWHIWWWRLPLVAAVFYTAASVHLMLGLWALYQRRHFRYTAPELIQLILGLSVPIALIKHFAAVRLNTLVFESSPSNYVTVLNAYWNVRPYDKWVQCALITIAWTHACIGLYYWLRLKPFFKRAAPFLLAVAVLLPPLGFLGAHQGAMEVTRRLTLPGWRQQNVHPFSPAQRSAVDNIIYFYFPIGYAGLLLLVFAARGVRSVAEARRGVVTLSYPDRKVRVPKGLTVLEASLRHRVPHASVCGGRARCSTCRIRVISDRRALPRPSGREAFVLQRVGAASDPSIRLACQLRPSSDIAFIPIFPPHVGADFVRNRNRVHIGEEKFVVSMFVDMRGSTTFAETRLPYDTLFLINRFLGAASEAVVTAGGQPNQFVGDGLLALFGLDTDPATACKQALRAAALVASNIEHLNHQFAADLKDPIQFGIGIHGGEVIVGDIGFKDHTVFTALGDAVNVAARMQDMTKTMNCKVLVSEEVCALAGISSDLLNRAQVTIRGRAEVMAVRTAEDPTVLMGLLEPAPETAALEEEPFGVTP
jgi:adenylate cyclase